MFKPKPYRLPVQPDSVAIQGQPGSFSHMASTAVFNGCAIQNYDTFEEPFDAVKSGKADLAVIPIQNSTAGHVPYVHRLLRSMRLSVIGEYFLPVEMCILTLPGVKMVEIKKLHSHIHALNQCKGYLSRHANQIMGIVHADTAGAAKMVSELGDREQGAISSPLAAQVYGLDINQRGIQDAKNNVTRFVVLSRHPVTYPKSEGTNYVTTLLLKPARSLDRPLSEILRVLERSGVFHTTPLEYQGPNNRMEDFYIEIFGHPDEPGVKDALEALRPKKGGGGIITQRTITGSFPAHHFLRFGRRNPVPA